MLEDGSISNPPKMSALGEHLFDLLKDKSASGQGTAVFYSGTAFVDGKEVSNYRRATEWVEAHPGTYTIDDTEVGKFISDTKRNLSQAGIEIPKSDEKILWSKASQMMAREAEGNAIAFAAGKLQPDSVLTSFELIEVMGNNPKVPSINSIKIEELDNLARGNPQTNWEAVTQRLAETEPKLEGAAIAAGTSFTKIGNVAGPVLLAAPTFVEGIMGGYHSYKNDEGAGQITLATLAGANDGMVDTVLPGARSGYADVVGDKKLTAWDRALNAADHATATATSVSAIATVAGVETGPVDIAPAAATAVSGIANIGVNLVKAGVKWSGNAGPDQGGGYIYDGTEYAWGGVKSGAQWTADKIDGMLFGGEDVKGSQKQAIAAFADSDIPVKSR